MSEQDEQQSVMVMAIRNDRSATLGQLAKAKAQAQARFLPLGKGKTANAGKYSYDYADLSACLEAVVPALSEFGLAVFQPTRIEAAQAIATTLLVHESNEFISGDFAVAIVDPTDAQSIGSATTYARRYGLLSMLAYAAGDEDDDGQAARGGDHAQKAPASAPACPSCGVVGSLMKGRADYGGGVLCWKGKGGCSARWPEGTPFPPTEKPGDPEPPKARAKKEPAKPKVEVVAVGNAAAIQEHLDTVQVVPPPGSEDCSVEGCWGGLNHKGEHFFEDPFKGMNSQAPTIPGFASVSSAVAGSALVKDGEPAPASPTSGEVTFSYAGKVYVTKGISELQMIRTFELAPAVDKRIRRGYSRELLGKILRKPAGESSRNDLTAEQAARFITALEQANATGEEQEP